MPSSPAAATSSCRSTCTIWTPWGALSTAEQEAIIGRTKIDNVELDDDGERKSHKTSTPSSTRTASSTTSCATTCRSAGPAQGEFGTYFIGYARDLWVIEQMLRNMFVGDPLGTYDRILDFSTAVTGTTFFVPSNAVLESLG